MYSSTCTSAHVPYVVHSCTVKIDCTAAGSERGVARAGRPAASRLRTGVARSGARGSASGSISYITAHGSPRSLAGQWARSLASVCRIVRAHRRTAASEGSLARGGAGHRGDFCPTFEKTWAIQPYLQEPLGLAALSRATVASATVRTAAAIIQAPFMCTKSALYEAAGCGGDDGGGGAGMVVSSTVYTK